MENITSYFFPFRVCMCVCVVYLVCVGIYVCGDAYIGREVCECESQGVMSEMMSLLPHSLRWGLSVTETHTQSSLTQLVLLGSFLKEVPSR